MATSRNTLHHVYRPSVELVPINPVYQERMYVSGWLFGISTKYKKEMVSCDGYQEVWSCGICGLAFESVYHLDDIIKVDGLK